MIFKPILLEQIFAGQKTVTRRPVKAREPGYWGGQILSIQPGKARVAVGRIHLHSVRRELLGEISRPGEAQLEGFASAEEFIDYWKSLYKGEWDPTKEVWRLEFTLLDQTREICTGCGGVGTNRIDA